LLCELYFDTLLHLVGIFLLCELYYDALLHLVGFVLLCELYYDALLHLVGFFCCVSCTMLHCCILLDFFLLCELYYDARIHEHQVYFRRFLNSQHESTNGGFALKLQTPETCLITEERFEPSPTVCCDRFLVGFIHCCDSDKTSVQTRIQRLIIQSLPFLFSYSVVDCSQHISLEEYSRSKWNMKIIQCSLGQMWAG